MSVLLKLKKPYLLYLGDSSKTLEIKTARGVAQWTPEHCLGEFRQDNCQTTLNLPKLTIRDAVAQGAQTLIIGLANSGGRISPAWHQDIIEALEQGLDVASGLHNKLTDISEFVSAAKRYNRQLIDLRSSGDFSIVGKGLKRTGKRILTVGTDCAVGKMYTALAITKEMKNRDMQTQFVATGQTGIFISGTGICIDAVVADFMSGAVEAITPDIPEQHWQVVEGQGSLFNPSFAGVSTALLHGAQPDYLVVCHEVGRTSIKDLTGYAIPTLAECIQQNLVVARLTNPDVKVAGIALNTRNLTPEEAYEVIKTTAQQFNLPCFDPMLTGVSNLVDAL
ncbi:DUF1611 domain-containing protein [Pseudoalteromonas sp. SCSIO 43088]|uniref:N-acetyltransferase DgcN n=1 Tax=Pseudoalteromonas sp. SCSIO 43088 TaxID=2822846 RepID=UPI00202B38AA|nr:N-acetyltransferase DgcN [Pseudoalteromonas sp. SCSIO 43088]URQ85218.1 DUF1611 domain-containing protein [Pseudoalteromonas sp. SCSIO 43088]